MLRLENYRSYIIFVDLNYKAFQTFLYYICLRDKLLVLLFKYNILRERVLEIPCKSTTTEAKGQLSTREVSAATATMVSCQGEKHIRGDASGVLGVPHVLPGMPILAPANPTVHKQPPCRSSTAPRGMTGTPWAAIPKLTAVHIRSLLLSEITPFITLISEMLSNNETASVRQAQFPTHLPSFPLPNI